MLSTNSLSAFSTATTTSLRPNETRLVRDQVSPVSPSGAAAKNAIPTQIPTVAPPRGSLVNLSV